MALYGGGGEGVEWERKTGALRTRSGINMNAPLVVWKQTHEALAKRYPNSQPIKKRYLNP